MKIKFELNDHPIEIDENPIKKLSEFLRQNNYFSIKNGCTRGKCGCCTVLVNNIRGLQDLFNSVTNVEGVYEVKRVTK